MLRRLKKFTVYSSVIVAGQASRALDDAPFAGQDESEDAKGLLRRLSECEDASYVQIFGECIDPDETNLYLADNEIDGTIPTEIGQLTALQYLNLPGNQISGPIPTEFGQLTALQGLSLKDNKIEGPIPPEIGELTALTSLYLESNQIIGTFPLALCDIPYCYANYGNPDLVAPCGTTGCCDLEKGETCSSSGGGDACSGLAKKTCKKTAGCAYKKKTCIPCSELSKKKCKKTDGCDYKKKQCSAASSCSGLSKRECKTTDGCKYKKKKDKCLAK